MAPQATILAPQSSYFDIMATQHLTARGMPENQLTAVMGQTQPHHDRYGSYASHLPLPLPLPLPSFNALVQQGHHVAAPPPLPFPSLEPQGLPRLHNFHGHSLCHITQPLPAPEEQPALFRQTWGPSSVYSRVITRFSDQQVHPTPSILDNGSRAGSVPSADLGPSLKRTSRFRDLPQVSRNSDIGVTSSVTSSKGSATGVKYFLSVRQQPVAARSCGSGERDRRTIDPPPIVQLRIEGPSLTKEESNKLLRYSDYIMSCSICDQSGIRDFSFMPEDYRQRRRLMGSVVSIPFVGKDEHDEIGCFFCFPDLSCRTPGSFRLKFSLVEVDLAQARQTKHFPILAETASDTFAVYTAKESPGIQASTPLVKRLKEQGCIIPIKKGWRESNRQSDQGDPGNEEQEGELSPARKRRRLGNGWAE
ncbi:hypothetical protein CDV36_016143 [Fusarium kuroshium]|uniref:Velvet domain-containing protein n=1 Tax=Fusarium kuroshium TaxID=2010991 RepID=A0A3M2QZJ8_9HYPO|nr:hypothetical protein CDV36_016143 [Fusarium kuroshium]